MACWGSNANGKCRGIGGVPKNEAVEFGLEGSLCPCPLPPTMFPLTSVSSPTRCKFSSPAARS